MDGSETSVWLTLMYLLATAAGLLAFVFVASVVAELIVEYRDGLRGRFLNSRRQGAAIDLVYLPIWLLLEAACLAGHILAVILVALIAWQAATGIRDWWHGGGPSQR